MNKDKEGPGVLDGAWLAIGIAVGVAIGEATGNLPLWIALGVVMGSFVPASRFVRNRRRK